MRQLLNNSEELCDMDMSPASPLQKPAKRRKPSSQNKSNDDKSNKTGNSNITRDSNEKKFEPFGETEQETSSCSTAVEKPVSRYSNVVGARSSARHDSSTILHLYIKRNNVYSLCNCFRMNTGMRMSLSGKILSWILVLSQRCLRKIECWTTA